MKVKNRSVCACCALLMFSERAGLLPHIVSPCLLMFLHSRFSRSLATALSLLRVVSLLSPTSPASHGLLRTASTSLPTSCHI